MGASEHEWERWLERLYSLRRDKRGSHERPHKPVLLLSIIDVIDRGLIKTNAVQFSEELEATFKRYFDVVKAADDKPTIENPFYFLSGDKFWRVNEQRLDDRIEGQRNLVTLSRKPVIAPSEEEFYPAVESLRWREEHLTANN